METEGFKWELGEASGLPYLEWGVLISSSNEIVGDSVSVFSSAVTFLTV